MRKALALFLVYLMFATLLLSSCSKKQVTSDPSSVASGTSQGSGNESADTTSSEGGSVPGETTSGSSGSNSSGSSSVSGGGTESQTGTLPTTKPGPTQDTSKDEVVDDGLNDWSKTASHVGKLSFDTGHPDLFENDASRVVRTKIEACQIVYKVNPVREFSVVTYFGISPGLKDEFTFYVSQNNKTWTQVKNLLVTSRVIPASGWERRTYTAYDLGSDYRYLKIVFPKTGKADEAYVPNVGRVLINRMNPAALDQMGAYVRRNPRTIYVDSTGGNDKNDGFSESKAIKTIYELGKRSVQPGDKILLKAGGTYTGQMRLTASGWDGNPIIIDQYGKGAKPKIVGKGDYAVNIIGENMTVRNLDISNPRGNTGITIETAVAGATKNITVSNCDIHDVKGDANYSHESGGIHIVAKTGGTKAAAVPSWFENLNIQNNSFVNVSRSGVFMHSFWTSKDGSGYNNYVSDSNGWYPAKGVKISGNSMNKIGGDGIVVIGAESPVMEKNILLYGQTQGRKGTFNAGIWPMVCNNAVMQYNEVGYMSLDNGAGDGQGFDIDGTNRNAILQYNYSHNNDGGFLLMCAAANDYNQGAIVRNNLSVNDTSVAGRAMVTISGPVSNAKIYNNTVYMGSGTAAKFNLIHADDFTESGAVSKNISFTNNVFSAASGKTITYIWKSMDDYTFDNNVFHGLSAPSNQNISIKNTKTFDPQFVQAGATGNGRNIGEKYRPKAGSPLLSGGTVISNNGGKDYFGKSTNGKGYYGAFVQ